MAEQLAAFVTVDCVDVLTAQVPRGLGLQAEATVEAATVRWDVALDEAVREDGLAEAIDRLS